MPGHSISPPLRRARRLRVAVGSAFLLAGVLLYFTKVQNDAKEEAMFGDSPKLVDGTGREFGRVELSAIYIPKDAQTIGLEKVPASMSKEFYEIYEVPADASALAFRAIEAGLFGGETKKDRPREHSQGQANSKQIRNSKVQWIARSNGRTPGGSRTPGVLVRGFLAVSRHRRVSAERVT